jgi:hypothetical protein
MQLFPYFNTTKNFKFWTSFSRRMRLQRSISCIFISMALQAKVAPDLTFDGFLNLLSTKLMLPSGWGTDQSQFLRLHKATWRYRKIRHWLMPRTGFKRLTSYFETYKKANALDDSISATWILILFGQIIIIIIIIIVVVVVVVFYSLAGSENKFVFTLSVRDLSFTLELNEIPRCWHTAMKWRNLKLLFRHPGIR